MTGKRRLLVALLVLTLMALGCSGNQSKDRRAVGRDAAGNAAGRDSSGASGNGGGSGQSGQGTETGGGGSNTGTQPGSGGSGGTGGSGGSAGQGTPSTNQPKRPPGWRVIAKAPIKGRHSHSAVWTGKEMIVWGGAERAGNAPIYLEDGAAYDPAADTWRKLPESPLGPRADHFAAWTGTEMLVWGGNPGTKTAFGNNELADGAAYDPRSDRWSVLPASPLAGRLSPLAAAVDGDVLLSWGFNRDPGQAVDGARFDPEAKSWANVAPVPSTDSAWCFDLAGCVGVDAGSRVVFAGEGLVYDASADRWAPVAQSPLADPFLDGKAMAWTGNRVVLWGGGRYTGNAEAPPTEVLVDSAGMAYDPAADHWTPLPPAPVAARARTRGIWTGAEFVVWGGEGDYKERVQHADGAAWTP